MIANTTEDQRWPRGSTHTSDGSRFVRDDATLAAAASGAGTTHPTDLRVAQRTSATRRDVTGRRREPPAILRLRSWAPKPRPGCWPCSSAWESGNRTRRDRRTAPRRPSPEELLRMALTLPDDARRDYLLRILRAPEPATPLIRGGAGLAVAHPDSAAVAADLRDLVRRARANLAEILTGVEGHGPRYEVLVLELFTDYANRSQCFLHRTVARHPHVIATRRGCRRGRGRSPVRCPAFSWRQRAGRHGLAPRAVRCVLGCAGQRRARSRA